MYCSPSAAGAAACLTLPSSLLPSSSTSSTAAPGSVSAMALSSSSCSGASSSASSSSSSSSSSSASCRCPDSEWLYGCLRSFTQVVLMHSVANDASSSMVRQTLKAVARGLQNSKHSNVQKLPVVLFTHFVRPRSLGTWATALPTGTTLRLLNPVKPRALHQMAQQLQI